MLEQPILRVQKNADRTTHKMIIPKIARDMLGSSYYMEVYVDHIELIPIKHDTEEEEE